MFRTHRPRDRQHARYELIGCALHGHELIGTDAAEIRPEDELFVRELGGTRWYRCLRCDTWQPMPPPEHPTAPHPPARDQIAVPLRGRALRDRYVLRVIALDRTVRVLILAPIATAIFLFAQSRVELHREYTKVLAGLQTAFGNPVNDFATSELSKIFALSTTKLYLAGVLLALYTGLLALEGVGLWLAKRWAEYLTLVETSVFVPFEVYELAKSVSPLKVLALVINIAVVSYLLISKRLFGVRGGVKVEQRERELNSGWLALDRTYLGPADVDPAAQASS